MQIADTIHVLNQGAVLVSGQYEDLLGNCQTDHGQEIRTALRAVLSGRGGHSS